MTCPHCWPLEAQALAADNATIAALQVENARLTRELEERMEDTKSINWEQRAGLAEQREREACAENARLARELAAMERTAHAIEDECTHVANNWHHERTRAEALKEECARLEARIATQRRICAILVGALRRQAARLREVECELEVMSTPYVVLKTPKD